MKFQKTLLSLGAVASVAGPMAATVSCGSDDDYSLKDTIVVWAAKDTANQKKTPDGYQKYMQKGIEIFKAHFPAEAAKYGFKILDKDGTFGVDWKTQGAGDKSLPDLAFGGTETIDKMKEDDVYTPFDASFLQSLKTPASNFANNGKGLLSDADVDGSTSNILLPFKKNVVVNFINGQLFFELLKTAAGVTSTPNSTEGAADLNSTDLGKLKTKLKTITQSAVTDGQLEMVAKKIWAIFGKGHDQNYNYVSSAESMTYKYIDSDGDGNITATSGLMTDLINLDIHKMINQEVDTANGWLDANLSHETKALYLTQVPSDYGMIPWVGSVFKGSHKEGNSTTNSVAAADLYQDSYGEHMTGDSNSLWSFHAFDYVDGTNNKVMNAMKKSFTPTSGPAETTPWTLPFADAGKLIAEFTGKRQMLIQSTYNDVYKQDEKFKTGKIAMYQSGGWNDGGFNTAAKANGFNLFSSPLGYYNNNRTNLDGGVLGSYLAKRLGQDPAKKLAVEHFIQCLMQKEAMEYYVTNWEGLAPVGQYTLENTTMSARSMSLTNANLVKIDTTKYSEKPGDAWTVLSTTGARYATDAAYASAAGPGGANDMGTVFSAELDKWAATKTTAISA